MIRNDSNDNKDRTDPAKKEEEDRDSPGVRVVQESDATSEISVAAAVAFAPAAAAAAAAAAGASAAAIKDEEEGRASRSAKKGADDVDDDGNESTSLRESLLPPAWPWSVPAPNIGGSGGERKPAAAYMDGKSNMDDAEERTVALAATDSDLARENARLRRIIRRLKDVRWRDDDPPLPRNVRDVDNDDEYVDGTNVKAGPYEEEDDVEEGGIGFDYDEDDDDDEAGVPLVSARDLGRNDPGAYRVRGGTASAVRRGNAGSGSRSARDGNGDHDTDTDTDDDATTVESAPVAPVPPPQQPQQHERSETLLIEANLVTDSDDRAALLVEATIVRRKRQALVVAALVLVAAIVAGLSGFFIQKRASERPKAVRDYALVPVTSLQQQFNDSLPASTFHAISVNATTPQALAYQWLFASGDHPDVPRTEALQRLIHRFALATLYYSTGGNGTWRTETNWLESTEHECLWFGVECGKHTDSAVAICTSEFGIPSVSCRLDNGTRIGTLDLSGNRLAGSIPKEIELFNASGIERILLEGNRLGGEIPRELGAIRTLQFLSVAQNQLVGSIPAVLGDMRNLVSLQLYQNKLTGSIPRAIDDLAKLEELDLSQNQLTGRLDPTDETTFVLSIDRLNALKIFDVAGNRLGGIIPTELGLLTNLYWLDVSSTELSGTDPTELGSLINLDWLDVSYTSVSGTIPTELGSLTNLDRLYMSSTSVSGTIPTELGFLTNLESLYVAFTSLSGTIPTELGSLTILASLDVSSTSVSGTIPTELVLLTNL
jgi:Leucine rich repeat